MGYVEQEFEFPGKNRIKVQINDLYIVKTGQTGDIEVWSNIWVRNYNNFKVRVDIESLHPDITGSGSCTCDARRFCIAALDLTMPEAAVPNYPTGTYDIEYKITYYCQDTYVGENTITGKFRTIEFTPDDVILPPEDAIVKHTFTEVTYKETPRPHYEFYRDRADTFYAYFVIALDVPAIHLFEGIFETCHEKMYIIPGQICYIEGSDRTITRSFSSATYCDKLFSTPVDRRSQDTKYKFYGALRNAAILYRWGRAYYWGYVPL